MSLRPCAIGPVPEQTARVAYALCGTSACARSPLSDPLDLSSTHLLSGTHTPLPDFLLGVDSVFLFSTTKIVSAMSQAAKLVWKGFSSPTGG